jgi:hypothetical protein
LQLCTGRPRRHSPPSSSFGWLWPRSEALGTGCVVVVAGTAPAVTVPVVLLAAPALSMTRKSLLVLALPLLATRAKATVRVTALGLGPMVTCAEKVPPVQLLALCEYTTGKDWAESSCSWQVVACATVPDTVTTPPLGPSSEELALTWVTVAGGAATNCTRTRALAEVMPLLATRAKATVRVTAVGLGPMVTCAEKVPPMQLLALCEYTTGKDWAESSCSWQVDACATVPDSVTTPPPAPTSEGLVPAETTRGVGRAMADAAQAGTDWARPMLAVATIKSATFGARHRPGRATTNGNYRRAVVIVCEAANSSVWTA